MRLGCTAKMMRLIPWMMVLSGDTEVKGDQKMKGLAAGCALLVSDSLCILHGILLTVISLAARVQFTSIRTLNAGAPSEPPFLRKSF